MKRIFREKPEFKTELVCSTCGKPPVSKARSDVTRFLFRQSRCQCSTAAVSLGKTPDALALALSDSTNSTTTNSADEKSRERELIEKASAILPDRYKVLSLIGVGGMGSVYKVQDKRLDKTFAIKIISHHFARDDNALQRFRQEARAAHELSHPNIAAFYEFAIGEQGTPYFVMEYLEGRNLADFIHEQGCMDVPRALDLFLQLAEAIEYACNKGVIHRDIKPSNIIVMEKDEVLIAKLVDFGIAKLVSKEGDQTQSLTNTGEVFGSPLYMSPEQCLGNEVDARSDIYAFGCVMYETLCGKPPLTGENSIRTILKHLNEDPRSIKEASLEQHIPTDLDYIVMRSLAKDATERYQDFGELANDLVCLREGTPIRRQRRSANRKRATTIPTKKLLAAGLGLGLSLIICGYLFTTPWIKGSIVYPSDMPIAQYPGSEVLSVNETGRERIVIMHTSDSAEKAKSFYDEILKQRRNAQHDARGYDPFPRESEFDTQAWGFQGSGIQTIGRDYNAKVYGSRGNTWVNIAIEGQQLPSGQTTTIQLHVYDTK